MCRVEKQNPSPGSKEMYILEVSEDSDELEDTELARLTGTLDLVAVLAALWGFDAAVFIAVSFGGGGVEVWSSLSLLLSGLKMLFVLDFFGSSSLGRAGLGGSLEVTF